MALYTTIDMICECSDTWLHSCWYRFLVKKTKKTMNSTLISSIVCLFFSLYMAYYIILRRNAITFIVFLCFQSKAYANV